MPTEGNTTYSDGIGESGSTWWVSNDGNGYTLTLKDAVITTNSVHNPFTSAIYASGDLDIVLIGNNTVVGLENDTYNSAGIYVNGTATVSLPYELKDGEKAEDVTVWYLSEDGTMSEVPCNYDPFTKLATFKANHFSLYVVGVANNTSWTNPFSDVKVSDWYASAVQYAVQNGLMNGTGSDTFSPEVITNRGMIAAILYRQSGSTEATLSTFKDVDSGAYYAGSVAWAQQKNIITGYGNGFFGPNDSITREQLATMLWKYAGSPLVADIEGLISFLDADKISSYAENALAWANQMGIINGKGGNLLDPKGKATRAEVAQIMFNFMQKSNIK